MLTRRTFGGTLAGAALWPALARAQGGPAKIPFYANVGPHLTIYDLDVEQASLAPRTTILLPSNLQYAWPSASKRFLYMVTSKDPMGRLDTSLGGHYGLAFAVDPATGALTPHGPTVSLPQRPIHMSLDHSGRFMLTAYNTPSRITVHRIQDDGSIGAEVPQPDNLDLGIYAHQVRATPSNKTITLVNLGPPGGLKLLGFEDGRLSNLQSILPGDGFGPRHLDFDPAGRFAYVSLQSNNRMDVYGLTPQGTLTPQALFKKNTLGDAANMKISGQGPGPIHVHPNGRIVYISNRSSRMVDFKGQQVFIGGENNIAVFSIDPKTGEPSLIQTADGDAYELRTFSIDPSARVMVAASQMALLTRDGDQVTKKSAGLSTYRVAPDGKLSFAHKLSVETSTGLQPAEGLQLWSGMLNMT